MRKIAAILLLAIMLINIWGYRWIFSFLEEKATTRLEKKLDAGDYNQSQLIEIKIPLSLPYYSSWKEYEPYYGETEWNGETYQYVKRKLSEDTLYLLCIPHTEKNTLTTAKHDYFRSMNDLQHDGSPQKDGQQPSPIKLMLTEFLEEKNRIDDQLSVTVSFSYVTKYFYLQSQFNPSTPEQPPEYLFC